MNLKRFKLWALAALAAVAAAAGVAQMAPAHTQANKAGQVTEKAVHILRPAVEAIPDEVPAR